METKVTVRPANRDDIEAFLRLQSESPEAAQWAAADYEVKLGHATTLALFANAGDGNAPAGFFFAQMAEGEMEILNFAVAKEHRRRGMGRALLAEGMEQGAALGARRCFLEVRASNHAELLFYQGQGFAELYRRRNYYSDPSDDAVVCARDLPPPKGRGGAA